MRFGAIDIGTNAARLLIGEVIEEGKRHFVKKVSYTRIPLRLGLEVFEDGRISDQKAIEFSKSMHAFRLISEVFEVKELRACATSAMREATNGKELQKKIKKETGVSIEIIEGAEEAKLILSNFYLLEFDQKDPFYVIDVGGGSTEISIFKKGEKVASRSFKLGTIRILKDKVKSSEWKNLQKWLDKYLAGKSNYIGFATGGNINKLHKLLGHKSDEPISTKELKSLSKDLRKLTVEERISDYNLKPDRADVIVPACDIYEFIFSQLKSKEVFVPKVGLSDGMVYEMHQRNSAKGK